MTCISLPEVPDRELLGYLDDEADERIAAHLDKCPHCRQRIRHLARLQDRLTARLYRFNCPSPEELGEYQLGVLPRGQVAAVASHLADCLHCTREIAQLEEYLDELTPDLEFSTLERIQVLVAQFVGKGRGTTSLESMAPAPAVVGLRGEEQGPQLYQAGDVQIVIEVQDDAERQDRSVLLGLVTGVDTHELKVHLWQADQPVTTASVEDIGTFVIPNLAPGSYELMLSGPEVEIHIQALEI